MAVIYKMDESKFDKWLATRPEVIKDLGRKFRPNKLYLLKESGHRVYPVSYFEDGTLRVAVSGEYNAVMFDRTVFGIKPEDLEECDLPPRDAFLGTALTEQEDIDAFGEYLRAEYKKEKKAVNPVTGY